MTEKELFQIVSHITFPHHWFVITKSGDGFLLQLRYNEPDADTGRPTQQHGRKWYVSAHATESEVVRTALLACLVSAEHTVRERFLYNGQRIFGPHISVDDLAKVAKCVEHRSSHAFDT